jgi:hypothetical protein
MHRLVILTIVVALILVGEAAGQDTCDTAACNNPILIFVRFWAGEMWVAAGLAVLDTIVNTATVRDCFGLFQDGATAFATINRYKQDCEAASRESESDSGGVPAWVIIAPSVLGGVIFLLCLVGCCCRRRLRRSKESAYEPTVVMPTYPNQFPASMYPQHRV